jgi:hypothetical protein
VDNDSGHGMLFRTFEGQARAKLFDMEDTGDNLKVIRAREDLHGRPAGQASTQISTTGEKQSTLDSTITFTNLQHLTL